MILSSSLAFTTSERQNLQVGVSTRSRTASVKAEACLNASVRSTKKRSMNSVAVCICCTFSVRRLACRVVARGLPVTYTAAFVSLLRGSLHSQPHCERRLVREERVELSTFGSGGRRSIQLSYSRTVDERRSSRRFGQVRSLQTRTFVQRLGSATVPVAVRGVSPRTSVAFDLTKS